MTVRHHDIVIIGTGFAGLGMAIELQRAGRRDFVLLERAERLGGTWHANHYPGCACDVPSPYYSFSFAPNPDWSRFYSSHDEIQSYLERCCDRFGVRESIRFGTSVTGLSWDDAMQLWTIAVDGQEPYTARAVVAAPGGLSNPAFPDMEGLGDFAGPWFHSAQWDHDVDLSGARVAVIGTGASAIQFVPQVARTAGHVDVFQRTPPWVLPKPDRRMTGVEKFLFRHVPVTQRLLRGGVWTAQEYMGLGNTQAQWLTKPLQLLGRAHIKRHIKDPELAERLTPDFAIGCKRVLLANDWYPTLAKEHVDVVSTGIERVTANGIRTRDGVEHQADVVIFGTGFRVTEPLGEMSVTGRGGADLRTVWHERGLQAHRGTTINGFPNFFLMPGPNTGTGHTSQVFMIEQQIRHAIGLLAAADARGAAVVEPTAAAQADYQAWIEARNQRTVWTQGGCNSWYLDDQGRNTTLWPGSSLAFGKALAEVREREFEFTAPVPASVPTEVVA